MNLLLVEEFALLALREETGKWAAGSTELEYSLPGCLLLDLFHQSRLSMDGKYVVVVDTNDTGDPLLDEAFEWIRSDTKRRKPKYWVSKLHGKMKKLQDRVVQRLIDKEILRLEEGKVLWVFTVKHYPEVDGAPEQAIRRELREVVLQGKHPAPRMESLIALAYTCNLTHELFDKEHRKEAKKRMKAITKESKAAAPVAQLIEEVQAAVASAVTAATAASAAGS